MGKEQNPRRVEENEAMAIARMLRTSPQKLNLVAGLIRGKKVEKALTDLTFSKRRIAGEVKKCLQSAIASLSATRRGFFSVPMAYFLLAFLSAA